MEEKGRQRGEEEGRRRLEARMRDTEYRDGSLPHLNPPRVLRMQEKQAPPLTSLFQKASIIFKERS